MVGRSSGATAGTVYLVGAGPGDPGLLTRRGAALLRRADVVVYDALVSPRLLELAPASAELVHVGKRAGQPSTPQAHIHRILVEAARRTHVVVRLKGGDPFVFGRGGEEALALARAGVPFRVVPGVTAALGAAAAAGIPLTQRGVAASVTLATGTGEDGGPTPHAPSPGGGTLVLYMAARRLPQLVARLLGEGWPGDAPAALVESATCPEQRVVTAALSELPVRAEASGLNGPALVVVGEVVRMRAQIDGWEARPLAGLSVVVARSRAQASRLVGAIRALGGSAVGRPDFERAPAPSRSALHAAARAVGTYDGLVLTSATGVDAFVEALHETGRDARALAGVALLCFGTATVRAARRYGLRPEVAASTYEPAAALEAVLRRMAVTGRRFLLATRPGSTSPIRDALIRAGGQVDTVLAYDQVVRVERTAAVRRSLERGDVDVVVFPSSSSVTTWTRVLGGPLRGGALVIAMGEETARALEEAGIAGARVPAQPTIRGILRELAEHTRAGIAAAGITAG